MPQRYNQISGAVTFSQTILSQLNVLFLAHLAPQSFHYLGARSPFLAPFPFFKTPVSSLPFQSVPTLSFKLLSTASSSLCMLRRSKSRGSNLPQTVAKRVFTNFPAYSSLSSIPITSLPHSTLLVPLPSLSTFPPHTPHSSLSSPSFKRLCQFPFSKPLRLQLVTGRSVQ